MDLGVGSTIFSGALVSQTARKLQFQSMNLVTRISKMLRSVFPLFLLGSARFITHKSVDYQLHVSEYGVHWNFFFTLALVEFVVTLFDILLDYLTRTRRSRVKRQEDGDSDSTDSTNSVIVISHLYYLFIGCFFVILQQFLLSHAGMMNYVLFADRTSFFSANKEGICSVLGYVSIYYFGCGMGRIIFQCATRQDVLRMVKSLVVMCMGLWLLHYVIDRFLVPEIAHNPSYRLDLIPTHLDQLQSMLKQGETTATSAQSIVSSPYLFTICIASRRLLNFGYVHYTLSINVLLVLSLLIVDLVTVPLTEYQQKDKQHTQQNDQNTQTEESETPSIIRASVNRNILTTFMLSNLMTGIVNLSMKTLFIGNYTALAIVTIYMFISMAISVTLNLVLDKTLV